jgi:putative ABC transport system ATP-binding protein
VKDLVGYRDHLLPDLIDLFKKVNQEMGQTIVMVTHEEWHVPYLDRIMYLKDGLIVGKQ